MNELQGPEVLPDHRMTNRSQPIQEKSIKRVPGVRLAIHAILTALLCAAANGQPILNLSTQYAAFRLDDKGLIVSVTARESGKEYSPAGHPSPLMSLHEYGQAYSQLESPVSAVFHRDTQLIELRYPNGAVAIVKPVAKMTYLRFQLLSLTPRGNVDNIVWGPLNTTISKRIGDLLGVVRDDDWAIGMLGLDDNTIAGPPVDGDCYQMGYYIHSPDPVKYPLPPQYHEGQWVSVGGNGVSDVAFYSHPEQYFQFIMGTGAQLEPEFGSSVAYHSRDRRRSYFDLYSLLPGFQASRPRHQVTDPIPGVDFIGSAVAVYACPDDKGLATLESIILTEGLPHPTFDGKWVHDPAEHQPDIMWSGPVDKEIEYAEALGLKHLSRDTGEFYRKHRPHPRDVWHGSVGYSDGHSMSYKDFAAEAARHGIGPSAACTHLPCSYKADFQRCNAGPQRTSANDLPHQSSRRDISATDTDIVVTDPSLLRRIKERGPTGDELQLPSHRRRNAAVSTASAKRHPRS